MINWKKDFPSYKRFVNMKDLRILVLVQRVAVDDTVFNGTDHSLILPATFVWDKAKDCAIVDFSNILGYWVDFYGGVEFRGADTGKKHISIEGTEYVGMPEHYKQDKRANSNFEIISWTLMKDIL